MQQMDDVSGYLFGRRQNMDEQKVDEISTTQTLYDIKLDEQIYVKMDGQNWTKNIRNKMDVNIGRNNLDEQLNEQKYGN